MAFAEPAAIKLDARLPGFKHLLAANLLEAEFRATLVREQATEPGERFLNGITWVHPNRPLTAEIQRVLATGYVRGADLWHLACALFIAPQTSQLTFLSLDKRQQAVAQQLGFCM